MKKMGSLCSILGIVLLCLVIIICAPLTIPKIFGYQSYAVVSGSMEPSISTGSIVYAKSVNPEEIVKDDVIVFYGKHDKDTIVTHRVVENNSNEKYFITKGDANKNVDMEPIAYNYLIGKVTFSIPVLGFVLPVLADSVGKVYLVGVIIAALLLRIVGARLKDDNNDTDQ